jgi:hypothetical protein
MQKYGFFLKIKFVELLFKVSAWLSNHVVCKIGLKAQPELLKHIQYGDVEGNPETVNALMEPWRLTKDSY